MAHYKGLDIAIAHNGNLVNTMELREELENDGAIFSTTNDTEVFMHLIVRALREHDLVDAIREACARVRGAYCLLVYAGGTMVAVRDPHGFHPLALGRLDGAPVLASETCAFDLLEADYERPIQPGEMLIMDGKGEHSEQLRGPLPERPRQCIFELVYFARPDSFVFGEQVYQCRKQMGWQLAHESTPDVDFIMPFPDSGVYSAVGFAQCAELPYEHAMIRNHYVGRTFIQPTQSMRNFGVRVKINPVRSMIEGKKICIVDDSIVRGTTMITRVKKLRELGAKEVHIRISCPPVKFPCFYGIDFASRGELIAAKYSLPEITKMLDVDSLHYLSIDGLLRSVMQSDSYCLACFDGNLMGRGEYIGQMIDAALEIREIRQVSKTKRTFEIANKSDLRFAVRPASYDYPMPVYAGQVLRIDIRQGEQVEFTNCILGKGRYYTRIFWE